MMVCYGIFWSGQFDFAGVAFPWSRDSFVESFRFLETRLEMLRDWKLVSISKMANRTVSDAKTVKGTNPQYLVEKIIRSRIYESKYWKEQCFALSGKRFECLNFFLSFAQQCCAQFCKRNPFGRFFHVEHFDNLKKRSTGAVFN